MEKHIVQLVVFTDFQKTSIIMTSVVVYYQRIFHFKNIYDGHNVTDTS